ncbi:unnamed protein product [Paramecium octaurelia]|uniref:Uncharacterized protein n=1 Tax=Paramecium octaurelia TaxID=43137 RepID=A0A8S1WL30_PAROT|nr:unnamed protein product [Paramecium octaurelia]
MQVLEQLGSNVYRIQSKIQKQFNGCSIKMEYHRKELVITKIVNQLIQSPMPFSRRTIKFLFQVDNVKRVQKRVKLIQFINHSKGWKLRSQITTV